MINSTIARLFFALVPPPQLARRTANAAAVLDAKPLAADQLHITMFILDDRAALDPALVAALRAIGGSVSASPVAILLDRLVASARSVALRPGGANPSLVALHRRLADLAAGAGLGERHGYRFSPHMTLGYRDGAAWSKRVAPVEWVADELVLIHSHVGRTRHDELGRWRLTGPGDPQLALF